MTEAIAKPNRRGRIKWSEPERTYPMHLIQQGWEALQLIDQLDFLTSSQVAKMLFWGQLTSKGHRRSLPAAHKAANEMCLRRLKDHRLLEVVPVAEYPTPTKLIRHELNLLTRQGAQMLKSHYEQLEQPYVLNWSSSLRTSAPLTIDHALRLNDVLANLIGAFRQVEGEVLLVLNDRQIKRQIAARQTYLGEIEPDALIVLRFGDVMTSWLVEVDTGSEPVRGMSANRFERKIERYGDYFASRFVTDPLFHGLTRPQVLVVTTSATRAHHLRTVAGEHELESGFWFSTMEWIEPPDRLATDAVWLTPYEADYQCLPLG